MALSKAEKIFCLSRQTFGLWNGGRCFAEVTRVGFNANAGLNNRITASTIRLKPYCGVKYTSTHYFSSSPSSSSSEKPWYQRIPIRMNDAFINVLGTVSPTAQKKYVQIIAGCRLFFHDGKHVYYLQKRMRAENLKLSDLDWRDIYIKKHMYKDITKVLPTLVLLCLPFVFYAMLPILFIYPRPFLSDQFFTREQILEFNGKFHETRLSLHPSIIKQLIKKVKRIPDSTESQSFLSAMQKLQSDTCMPLDSRDLLQHKALFEVVLSHKTLPRTHLVKLCKLHSLRSFLLPSNVLKRRLTRTLKFIHAMDMALMKENLQGLPQEDLEKLCFERGLYSYDVDRGVLAAWLQDWVYLSTNITENEQSLLSHAIVLLVKGHRS